MGPHACCEHRSPVPGKLPCVVLPVSDDQAHSGRVGFLVSTSCVLPLHLWGLRRASRCSDKLSEGATISFCCMSRKQVDCPLLEILHAFMAVRELSVLGTAVLETDCVLQGNASDASHDLNYRCMRAGLAVGQKQTCIGACRMTTARTSLP